MGAELRGNDANFKEDAVFPRSASGIEPLNQDKDWTKETGRCREETGADSPSLRDVTTKEPYPTSGLTLPVTLQENRG
ncbi:hypothetical protein NDU88_005026 [Pleurodeles waltl]|uniref:Prolactin receptor n=1 Tax=Pleurodeles waltl TaxID=8319 RepID=A0AAV7SKI1_PLEWA|nr:hypothetical protein NDU88_005026 [Pleurodeles waltl]